MCVYESFFLHAHQQIPGSIYVELWISLVICPLLLFTFMLNGTKFFHALQL